MFLATGALTQMRIHKRIQALGRMKCFPCQFSNTFKSTQISTSALMSGSSFDQGVGMWNSEQAVTGFECTTACLLSSTDFFVKSASRPWFGIT